MLVFSNIFNTAWTIEQIDLWLGSPNSSERLIPEEGQKNVPPIVINGEVSANIERENINKN